MWKLWHKLFGWDYVFARSCSGLIDVVCRIRRTPNGREYVKPWSVLDDMVFLDQRHGWTITHLTRDTSNNN